MSILYDDNEPPIEYFRGNHAWLSNFEPCTVEWGCVRYPSVEHAYQAAKFSDLDVRDKIRKSPNPKKLSRCYTPIDNWDAKRRTTMEILTYQKFVLNYKFKKLLENTGMRKIVEGNHWNDTYWGVCNGVGDNTLGNIIMQHRYNNRNDKGIFYE